MVGTGRTTGIWKHKHVFSGLARPGTLGRRAGLQPLPSPNPPSAFPTAGPGVCVYSHEEGPWLLKDTHPTRVKVTRTYISVVLLGVGSSVASLSPR